MVGLYRIYQRKQWYRAEHKRRRLFEAAESSYFRLLTALRANQSGCVATQVDQVQAICLNDTRDSFPHRNSLRIVFGLSVVSARRNGCLPILGG